MADQNLFPTLDELDRSGAVREAAEAVDGHTRAAFFGKLAASAGGGALIGGIPVAFSLAQSGGVGRATSRS